MNGPVKVTLAEILELVRQAEELLAVMAPVTFTDPVLALLIAAVACAEQSPITFIAPVLVLDTAIALKPPRTDPVMFTTPVDVFAIATAAAPVFPPVRLLVMFAVPCPMFLSIGVLFTVDVATKPV
jgi:hypothetical protein